MIKVEMSVEDLDELDRLLKAFKGNEEEYPDIVISVTWDEPWHKKWESKCEIKDDEMLKF